MATSTSPAAAETRPGVRVGVDVGGTFTDAVLLDGGRLHVAKTRTTPKQIATGFLAGLDELAKRSGIEPAAVDYLVHGTTVATNAIVQGGLAKTALITNAGFRDLLEIGTQMRTRVYDLWNPLPAPLVPRERCLGVRGRIDAGGAEIAPLEVEDVVAAAASMRELGVESVAVVLLFSFSNASHEQQVREVLARELPGVPVSLSCEVAPEFREYLRASTTVLNAALLPLVGGYLDTLSEKVGERGVTTGLHLMQSNGGVATAGTAARLPVALAASGPAAGVIGAARLSGAVGEHDLLTFDMGGTTADVAVVADGLPQLRFVGDQGGHPVNLPQIDVLSVGAGGGSIASVDAFGSLTVGPESAGSDPGPACYGGGGTMPTVTDAHAVIGTLDPDYALGGTVRLDVEAARAAIRRAVAEPLEISVEEAAEAILRIANANMSDALRRISVACGHDPRRFALVGLGGAGPMHSCAIADELGVPKVVVPRHPGVTAALGLLLSDVRHDVRQSWISPTADALADPSALDAALGRLEDDGRALLAHSGHAEEGTITFELDMRYRGQAYNLVVPLASRPVTAETIAAADQAFRDAHEHAYDYTPGVDETEIVTLRARASAPPAPVVWLGEDGAELTAPAAAGTRAVWVDGTPVDYAVIARTSLTTGAIVAQRTIVEQEDTTVVIPAGWQGRVEADGILVLEKDA